MDWGAVATAGCKLRGIEESRSYGRPALKVRGRLIACKGKQPGHFVLMLDHQRTAFLLDMEPEIFLQTPHYVGWPCILVRYDALPPEDLPPLLAEAWALKAPRAWQ